MTPWGCPRVLLELFLELRVFRGGPRLRSHLRCWPGALHDAQLRGGWGVAAHPPVRLSSSSASHGHTEEGAGGSSSSSSGSSSGGGKAHASIKSGLRELYRLVHPDLWTAYPVAKAENERSFKLLQEYLSLARARDADSFQAPAARVQYRFCFYMHPPTQHSAGQEQARADQAAGAAQGQQPTTNSSSSSSSNPGAEGGSSSRGGGDSSGGSKVGGAIGAAAEQLARAPPPPHPASPAPTPAHPSLTCIEVVLPPPSPRPGPPANSPYTHPSTPSHQQQQQQQQEGGAGGKGEGGRGPTQAAGGEPDLAPSSRRALAKLLRACGIQVNNPEVGQGEGEGEGADLGGGRAPLASFLPAAVEAQRLAQAAAQDPRLRVANMRGAMRLQRKVLVSFKEAAAVPPQQQAEALGQLAALMDSLPDLDLAGCSVLMGAPQGIDKLGNLCLELGPAAAAGGGLACMVPGWRDLLTGVDLSFVRQRKDLVQATRAMERDVARVLGLSSVFASSPTLVAEPSYSAGSSLKGWRLLHRSRGRWVWQGLLPSPCASYPPTPSTCSASSGTLLPSSSSRISSSRAAGAAAASGR
ncbi:hypothetical protein V8C86DRAFT_889233 [Haematococcus lacustris]